MARVFVAMSGGVDSSVAAALLVRQGHDVVGVTMQLWPAGDVEDGCCAATAARDARRVCDALRIAHYTLNFREDFRREVVEPFCDDYAAGRTPNPCIVCNDRVKFGELWRRAAMQGADFLATGHYARIERDDKGVPWLARGVDAGKDQSYFLYRMTPDQLEHTIFPVGTLTKSAVRAAAAEFGLPTATKAESQEICFVPGDDHLAFVGAARPGSARPGPVIDRAGRVLGQHRGVAGYTVGQRRGLGLAAQRRLYVLEVRSADNVVVVGGVEELLVREIVCSGVAWRGETTEQVEAQVRYRQHPLPATTTTSGGTLTLEFAEPLAGVAPGQAAVCYNGGVVLGGGVVEEAR